MQEFEEDSGLSEDDIKNLEGIDFGGIFERKFAYVNKLGKDYDDGVVNMFKARDRALGVAIKALKQAEELNFHAMEAAQISPNIKKIDRSFNYEQNENFSQAKDNLEALQTGIKLESLLETSSPEVEGSKSIIAAINDIINEVAEPDVQRVGAVDSYRGAHYNFYRDNSTQTVVVEDVSTDRQIFLSEGETVLHSDLSPEDISIFLEYSAEIDQSITDEEMTNGFEIE